MYFRGAVLILLEVRRSMQSHEIGGAGRARWIRAVKAGTPAVLTEEGVPIGIVQPLRPATKAEVRAIHELIESGLLEVVGKFGRVREWKWKRARAKAA
jgi:antitoxin (DNA-binding transcriptional repressor) of toxin-antitoxin stability system